MGGSWPPSFGELEGFSREKQLQNKILLHFEFRLCKMISFDDNIICVFDS